MDKELEKVIASIDKQYGEGSVQILGTDEPFNIVRCPSGSLQLDLALGGGFPDGRIIELYGPESGGKTTVALLYIAELQKKYPEKYTAFIDAEYALDINLARSYGLYTERMVISQPENGEESFNIAEALMRSGKFSTVVVDSVSALVPKSEAESEMEQQSIGLQARMMSKALRKLTSVAGQFDCSIVFINQIREKVGAYGNPETTSGGRALRFHSSIRVEIRRGEPIKIKDDVIGHEVKCKITKNKTYTPYKQATFNLIYGKGIDTVDEIGNIAINVGLVKQAGAWLSMVDSEDKVRTKDNNPTEEPYKWQGREKFITYLKTDSDLINELEQQIRGQV
jgi:recombination protein RecA